MSFNLFFNLGKRRNKRERRDRFRNGLCLFLILIFLLSFFHIDKNLNNDFYLETDNITEKTNAEDFFLETSGAIPLLQDPFTINFSDIRSYFNANFTTDLVLYDNDFNIIPTYFRDEFSREVYSEDNLLLYKTLMKELYDEVDTRGIYSDLKSTPLWLEGNISAFEYGFIRSIDGDTGAVTDYNRYLVDNLMPIFLLIENSEDPGNAVSELEKIFDLISSPVFKDEVNGGFFEFNSSSGEKDAKSNLYSILANLLIHRYRADLPQIADDAYKLANETMSILIDKMWDTQQLGFYDRADNNWTSPSGEPGNYKYLDTNALGIIALIDFWIENESMDLNSKYFKNATLLYEKLDDQFLDGAYQYARTVGWSPTADFHNNRIDLEANSIMMQACLKLFEATGNITYYNRSIELYKTFENKMYDSSNNAYETSIGSVINNNKNFSSNLMLIDAYLKAVELYYSTVLDATFNTSSQVPDFIIDQDVLNLTCDYAFEKTISHFTGSNITRYNNITNANITYFIYYPNSTIFKIEIREINANTTNLSFLINESFPIEDGYSIQMYANTTFFGTAFAKKTFNVISGLVNKTIIGLEGVNLHQGITVNITLPINNTRFKSIKLNVSLEGFGIENVPPININFSSFILTNVSFNLTIRNDATPGKRNISFKFKNGSILYLDVVKVIKIVNALNYSNLIYRNKIVAGNRIQISMNLINFFPNANQSFNVSFSGNYINDVKLLAFLDKNQMRTVFYSVLSASTIPEDSIEIEMSISVEETIFYTEILTVEIIPKFEIISLEFSEDVTQGVNPHIIIIIQNNLDSSEEFTLIINDEKVSTDLDELSPGENRIEYEIERFYNPYEFGAKTVVIEIEDESGDSIVKKQFEYEVGISAINLIFFYLFPILIPIAVILYYKNKDIKNKLLRR